MLDICLTNETRTGALQLRPARLRQTALAVVEIEGVEVPVVNRIDTVVDPIVGVHRGIHEEIHEKNEATIIVDDSSQISPIQINTTCTIRSTYPLNFAPVSQGPASASLLISSGQVSLGAR